MLSTRSRAIASALLPFLACACKGLPDFEGLERLPQARPEQQQAVPQPPVGPPVVQDPMLSIQRYEAARSDGAGFLQFQLVRGEESTRERAATALGRLPLGEHGSGVSNALVGALDDESPRVRAAAAFALGLRADVATAAAVAARGRAEELEGVRARLVEAASRIDEPRTHAFVLGAFADPRPVVRQEAVLGTARWAPTASDGATADAALLGAAGADQDEELRWRALFALARRKCEGARKAFEAGLGSREVRTRLYAAQGLGSIAADPGSAKLLAAALTDHDWRVVCEALVALGKHPDPGVQGSLAALVRHPSPHVRRSLFEALGAYVEVRAEALALLEKARVDASANVRAAAIEAGARLVGDEAAPDLELRRIDKDPLVRAGAARGAGWLGDRLAVPMLLALTRDPDLRVAGLAIEGLGKHLVEEARARLLELLEHGDNGLALAAIEALRNQPQPADLPAMEACWRRASGDIALELRAGLLLNAAAIGGERAAALVEGGLQDADPFVAARAARLLLEKFPGREAAAVSRAPERVRRRTQLGELERFASNPRVEVLTTRGALVFELFPDEAPLHVHNFTTLARAGHYAGLPFHRVVPDFVVQGGDYRGDGNGARTWDDAPLPAEFTPRKFVRGSLGMPRGDDPDSGGSQIFVTHRETPHLDGRYTLFGQLLQGFDVLDALEVGDRIREVRLLAPFGTR